jgi:mannosyltransferase
VLIDAPSGEAELPLVDHKTAAQPIAMQYLPVVAPALLVFVIGLFGIGRPSMYGTEEATTWVGRLPTSRIFAVLNHGDAVHGLYYLIIHGVFRVFGSSVVTLRLPSLIGASVAVGLVVVIARRLSGSTPLAVIAGVMTAVTPFIVYYADSGRSYAIDAALALAATLAFLWAVDDRAATRRWLRWLAYGALLVVAGYMHEMTTLVIACHAVTLGLARVRLRLVGAWLATAVAAGLALLPIIVISHEQEHQLSWIRPISGKDVTSLITDFFGPSQVAVIIMAALVALGALLPWRRTDHQVTLRNVALPLFLLPAMLLLGESLVSTPLYGGARYILFSLPAGIMLAASGLYQVVLAIARADFRRQCIAAVALVSVILVAQGHQLLKLHGPGAYPENFGAVAAYIATHSQGGDGELLIAAGSELAPLGYPNAYRKVTNLALAKSPYASARYYGVRKPMSQVHADMLQHKRIWVIGKLHASNYRRKYGMELRILHLHFRLASTATFNGAQVALYNRVDNRHLATAHSRTLQS